MNLAFQAKDELDIENFNELMEEFERAKSSSNWETKLKISIPILELVGVKLGLETKFNLKSWLGSLNDRANELMVKYSLS